MSAQHDPVVRWCLLGLVVVLAGLVLYGCLVSMFGWWAP